MKNNLTTTQKTEVVLAKSKRLLGITAKILSAPKALAISQTNKSITIIGDLMWENVSNTEEYRMDWSDAMEYAKNLRLGGYDDWRLPTLEEIASVVGSTAESKGFILHRNYWTSTTFLHDFADCIGGAWVRDFGFAKDRDSLSNINSVRCVRKNNKF